MSSGPHVPSHAPGLPLSPPSSWPPERWPIRIVFLFGEDIDPKAIEKITDLLRVTRKRFKIHQDQLEQTRAQIQARGLSAWKAKEQKAIDWVMGKTGDLGKWMNKGLWGGFQKLKELTKGEGTFAPSVGTEAARALTMAPGGLGGPGGLTAGATQTVAVRGEATERTQQSIDSTLKDIRTALTTGVEGVLS